MLTIPFRKFHPDAHIPTKAHPESDAGWDLYAIADQLSEGAVMPVNTGIAMNIPQGWCGIIKGRSGLALRYGLNILGGVIDSGYTGEIKLVLYCPLYKKVAVKAGDKIAQLLLVAVPEVTFVETLALEKSERGSNGFGSSGI